jgi:molybdenum cofactor cytidylyltransferase
MWIHRRITENWSMEINFSALLLAAGSSSRMGQPKLLLPWGTTTVIGQILSTLAEAGMQEVLVVTGAERQQIEQQVVKLAGIFPVRAIHNPGFEDGGMLSSIQTGLAALGTQTSAALIALGDQPQIRKETIQSICTAFIQNQSPLVIPSYQHQRGHPWLVAPSLWPEMLALSSSTTARQFLNTHAGLVEFVAADESILKDLDTPEEYTRQRP